MNISNNHIKPFIVFSHQRSGTTKLCNELLSCHPDVFSFDELFNQPNHVPTEKALKERGLNSFYNLRAKIEGRLFGSINRYKRYHERFLNTINKNTSKRHIGFKLFANQVPPSVLREFLCNQSNKIIVLQRKNLAKAAVSIYLLLFEGQRNSNDKKELSPYKIDIDWCANWIAKNRLDIKRAKELMIANKKDFFYVEYEDLFNIDKINEIFTFLGVSPIDNLPKTGLKKMSSEETYKKMINLKEFEAKICNEYNGFLFDKA